MKFRSFNLEVDTVDTQWIMCYTTMINARDEISNVSINCTIIDIRPSIRIGDISSRHQRFKREIRFELSCMFVVLKTKERMHENTNDTIITSKIDYL